MNDSAARSTRNFRRLLVLRSVVAWVLLTSSAEAQEARSSAVVLLAPTMTAPARQRPGSMLSAEVRVSAALTPPPGVQQTRALRDWSARLTGSVAGAPTGTHEYRLAVANVRPSSGSSLRYRVQIPLPVWLAPGIYTLTITGPGGETHQADAVQVSRPDVDLHGAAVWLRNGMQLVHAAPGARFFPATSVGLPTQAPAVIGFLPPTTPTPKIEPAAVPQVVVGVEPSARAGFSATLRARGVPKDGTVAWSLSDGTTAYGAANLPHMFEVSGPFHGDLMAIGPDGAMSQVHFQIEVEPGVRFGCETHRPTESRSNAALIAPLILTLALLKRRPRRSAGISSPP